MKEFTVKIKYDNETASFSHKDVYWAMTHIFGINTNFEVSVVPKTSASNNKQNK
tara:strand:+ start:99 stop:260 length:162 start_codon:yes stop_codon:yes gene_type:complete